MLNSVSFCGSTTSACLSNNKKSAQKPCKHAGAAIGAGLATASIIKNRGIITSQLADAVAKGMPKGGAMAALGVGVALGAGLLIGTGAFIGKMVGKAIDHFRKPADNAEAV